MRFLVLLQSGLRNINYCKLNVFMIIVFLFPLDLTCAWRLYYPY